MLLQVSSVRYLCKASAKSEHTFGRGLYTNFQKEGSGLVTGPCQKVDFFQEHCNIGKQTLTAIHVFPQTDRPWEGFSGGMCCALPASHLRRWESSHACLAFSSGQLQPPVWMCWAARSPPGRLVICLAEILPLPAASGALLLAIN